MNNFFDTSSPCFHTFRRFDPFPFFPKKDLKEPTPSDFFLVTYNILAIAAALIYKLSFDKGTISLTCEHFTIGLHS